MTSSARGRVLARVLILLAGGSASACAAIWGFEDSLDGGSDASGRDGGTSPDATRDGAGDALVDRGKSTDTAPSDAAVGDPCATDTPETYAYYVAPSGEDTESCGRLAMPCATLAVGVGNALAAGAVIVNVAEGSYDDTLTLVAGLTVVGGWIESGGAWSKDTSSTASTQLVIQPTANNTTAMADSLGGAATLCTLTLGSKPLAAAGETLYGLFATGTGTTVHLRDVDVTMSGGGAGQPAASPGAPGDPGDPAGCSPGSGLPGRVAEAGAPGPLGTFSVGGYLAGSGGPGQPGASGSAGTVGGAGPCITCDTGCNKPPTGSCGATGTSEACGAAGIAGCSGKGGGPGAGGGGGGASVAVFAWGATVTISASRLVVQSGGAGAPGGPGADGGQGSVGLTGDAGATCPTACVAPCMLGDVDAAAGGGPGGQGGHGSSGGLGGGGSGGFSCPIVRGAGAVVTVDTTAIVPSVGGPGAGGAPRGGIGDDAGVCSF